MSKSGYRRQSGKSRTPGKAPRSRRARFEQLERREVLSAPTLAAIDDVTLYSGAPLHIPLDGFDEDGQTLTYSVEISGNDDLASFIPQGNRSMRINVADFGEMVFELFEGRVPRVTEQIITLAEAGFYDGLIFHRVIDEFMIQGGDQTGTGSGPSPLGDFDDQFHLDLRHTSSGVLSMAKSNDDTNGTQFFITDIPDIIRGHPRHLDFSHSVFGLLIEGESVREAISEVEMKLDANGKATTEPLTPVVMESVEIFHDNQNGTLMLSMPNDFTGLATATVVVTATDEDGNQALQWFQVIILPDEENSPPFLRDVPQITTAMDTPVIFQLEGVDAEGDDFYYLEEAAIDYWDLYEFGISHEDLDSFMDLDTGLTTVTPRNGLTGWHEIYVAVGPVDYDSSTYPYKYMSLIDYQTIPIYIEPAVTIDTFLVLQPTAVDAGGEVASLPESRQWIDEWDSFYVEIWASTPDDTDMGVAEYSLDLGYNTDYFTATLIEYGPAFPNTSYQTGSLSDSTGEVVDIGAVAATPTDAGDDAHVLLARVYFEPTIADVGVVLDINGQYPSAVHDLGLAISGAEVLWSDSVSADVRVGAVPDTEVWPVTYDMDDDGFIGLSDLGIFTSVFRDSANAPGATYAVAADFDRSGFVGPGDFAFLAVNYERLRTAAGPRIQHSVDLSSISPVSALRVDSSTVDRLTAAEYLTTGQLVPIVEEAFARFDAVVGPQTMILPRNLTVEIVDLPGNLLGQASANTIWIDIDAAAYGWFVDTSPGDDAEFVRREGSDEFMATLSGSASGKVDLLTAVMHELGHLLGYDHADADNGDDIMASLLSPGVRHWLIGPGDAERSDIEGQVGDLWSEQGLDVGTLDGLFAGE